MHQTAVVFFNVMQTVHSMGKIVDSKSIVNARLVSAALIVCCSDCLRKFLRNVPLIVMTHVTKECESTNSCLDTLLDTTRETVLSNGMLAICTQIKNT